MAGGAIRAALCAAVVFAGLLRPAFAQIRSFDIPSQDAGKSLPELARQAGIQVIAPGEMLRGVVTPEIKGAYQIDDALNLMLKGTGLVASHWGAGVMVISRSKKTDQEERKGMLDSKKNSVSIVALILSALTGQSYAQSVGDTQAIETVTVTGYRASLNQAVELKRESVGVRDSIVAEDIGKYPATNIAESLVRVPGVALSRDMRTDEGKTITVRGLNPTFTIVTINGIPTHAETTTTIGSNARAVDLDLFGPDLFSRVDFYKSPQANLDEGGIGGVIDLHTPHPFDYDGMKVNYSVGYSMNSIREVPLPGVTFQASNTWGPFGALIAVTFKENDYQLYGWEATSWTQARSEYGQNSNAITYDFGPSHGGFDPRANIGSYTTGNIEQAFVPRFARYHGELNQNTRLSALASLQFRPNEKWDFTLDLIAAKMDQDRNEYVTGSTFRSTSTSAAGWAACQANAALIGSAGCSGLVPLDVMIDDNNNLYGTFANAAWFNENRWYEGTTKYASATLSGKYQATDALAFSAVASMATDNGFFSDNRIYTQARNGITTYDATSDYVRPSVTTTLDLTNPALYDKPAADPNLYKEGDRVIAGKLNGTYEFDSGLSVFGKVNVEAGVSYVSTQKTNDRRASAVIVNNTPFVTPSGATAPLTALSFSDIAVGHLPWDNFLEDAGNVDFPHQWSSVPRSVFLSMHMNQLALDNTSTRSLSSVFDLTEAVESAYIMAQTTGELFGNTLRLSGGFRVAKTRLWGYNYGSRRDDSNNTVYFPVRLHNSYDTVLPNISLAYDVLEDVVFRASYGKTITRPALGSIAGSTSVPSRWDLIARSGNDELKPMMANNVDLGVEWYFQPESVLSFGVFYKGVKGLVNNVVTYVPFSSLGLPEDVLSCAVWCDASGHIPPDLLMSLTHPINQNPMVVRGFEIYYQQPFTFLPEPFDGLGALANFTYTTGKQSGPGTGFAVNAPGGSGTGAYIPAQIDGLSNYTYSATAYYEKNGLNIRLSYNWRSKAPYGGNWYNTNERLWDQARGTLDGTIGYAIFDDLEVRLDVTNILGTIQYNYMTPALMADEKYGQRFSAAGHDTTRRFINYWHGRNFMLTLRGHL